jgi:hypothetical protein
MYVLITIGIIVIYSLITWGVVVDRCTSYNCRDDFSYVDTELRDATTKDLWIGLCWPLLLIKLILKLVVGLLNTLLIILCLLVGFKYKNTNMYKNLEKWGI